ncbi:MAG TPA: N-acetyltransferase [Balneola sp.]|jgi:UDP-2-acetamido-3-amino-2,3-dideoxy-glucuronate N-acetyltransferase|nr:N-acetyltransferase [Balneola sp.]MAO77123.1 N-acetyltransferase [Balneola sp.]MBF63428.1 N-acetyltransferase [Balneola sp.]HAH52744.1 N-acetyltransferase [Balneola sp.]HBZ37306.1 N-acetyltransferase [Balneola sp.]|tara:strand:- start:21388 stop:21975 length:588 start_codon:yes stop_codon:yes gene_type:complete
MSNDYFEHETAIVGKDANIGSGTKIWHWVHVMNNAIIGENCVLGQNVFVGSKAVLGKNVRVQNNVSIYDEVILEDDVFCGPSMVFTNVINPRSHVQRKNEYKKTFIRKGASIGANATVVCGNEIGEFAFIGAGSVITKPVPAFALVVGNPGKQIGWVSKAGIRLVFEDNYARCSETNELYKLENNTVYLVTQDQN